MRLGREVLISQLYEDDRWLGYLLMEEGLFKFELDVDDLKEGR